MAYDEDLANRIRELVSGEPEVTEMAMFGGLAFLVNGNMSVAASGQGGLLVRVDPEDTEALLAKPHAQPFEMRGRPMDGWLRSVGVGRDTRVALAPAEALGARPSRRRVRRHRHRRDATRSSIPRERRGYCPPGR